MTNTGTIIYYIYLPRQLPNIASSIAIIRIINFVITNGPKLLYGSGSDPMWIIFN